MLPGSSSNTAPTELTFSRSDGRFWADCRVLPTPAGRASMLWSLRGPRRDGAYDLISSFSPVGYSTTIDACSVRTLSSKSAKFSTSSSNEICLALLIGWPPPQGELEPVGITTTSCQHSQFTGQDLKRGTIANSLSKVEDLATAFDHGLRCTRYSLEVISNRHYILYGHLWV